MEAVVFIGAIIAGLTQVVKLLSPKVQGALTVAVAVLAGVLVAILDTHIGVMDVTIAEGVFIALGTVGVVTTVDRV